MQNRNRLWKRYGIELETDVFLAADHHVSFYVDLAEADSGLYLLSGDLAAIGLPSRESFTIDDFLPFIEADNALAEVEGRPTFKQDLLEKLQRIETDGHLYVPIKQQEGTLWLSVAFRRLKTQRRDARLLFGQVIRRIPGVPAYVDLYRKAHQDSLTGFFTRETLKKHIETSQETADAYGLYIDLDNFKQYNDRFGHQVGDQLLRRIARHFIDHWEHNVLYYRIGGDEFFIYTFESPQASTLQRARKVIDDIRFVSSSFKGVPIGASIGVASIPGRSYYDLLDVTDQAMYVSKEKGGSTVTLYRDGEFH